MENEEEQRAAAEEIGRLAKRIFQFALDAGLYVSIKIGPKPPLSTPSGEQQ
jgi:hypothetical protein